MEIHSMMRINGERITNCSDHALMQAIEDIKFEMACRVMQELNDEEMEMQA
jgi:hypothetical protein